MMNENFKRLRFVCLPTPFFYLSSLEHSPKRVDQNPASAHDATQKYRARRASSLSSRDKK
jgi:hypothetical protein